MKTPSTDQIMDGVENVVAISVGAMVGSGIAALLPAENNAIYKGAASVLAVAGSVMIKGKSRGSKAIANMLRGSAATHAVSLTQDQAQKLVAINPAPTVVDKFVEGAVGLRGNEYSGYQKMPRLTGGRAIMPSLDSFSSMDEGSQDRAASLV